ncbi:hypothetical protein FG93_00968 [Bosea sp. LC85]|uniref:hypothetical protein n=1 Tax=Bosea sp. LC85 TaxID=1502851 RepID=UPI0004E317E1|nr:hypothetical protein [Bosea sp. LC85]KFC74789.1 hypothetical protein FG93_00968 [Bosea sp. LC85]
MHSASNIAALMNGYGLIFQTLIEHLDAKGSLAKDDLLTELSRLSKFIEADWKDFYGPGAQRLDVSVIRGVVEGLKGERPYAMRVRFGEIEGPQDHHNDR